MTIVRGRLVLASILLGLLMACSQLPQRVDSQVYSLPDDYASFAWLPDGSVIAQREWTLWHVEIDGSQVERLPLPDDPLCGATRFMFPDLLPDGRLGMVKWCLNRWPDQPPGLGDERYMMAYDLETGELVQLVQGPLPSSRLSSAFTWNPEMSRGIQLASNGLVGILYWITPNGSEPITVTVGAGRKAWSLDISVEALLTDDDIDIGLVGLADWSADGNQIAFWASPDAVGRDGFARADGEWQLFVMSPYALQPQSVLRGIYRPTAIKWSPNGKWLSFYGEAGARRQQGLWLLEVATSELLMIAAGDYAERGLAWSPDGQSILSNRCCRSEMPGTEFIVYHVEHLTAEAPF